MLSLSEEMKARMIDVEWEANKNNLTYDAVISILGEDRKGLLAECSKICEQMDININGVNLRTDQDNIVNVTFTLAILNLDDVEKIMARMRQVPGVVDVYRGTF